jgi:hypothetical protein
MAGYLTIRSHILDGEIIDIFIIDCVFLSDCLIIRVRSRVSILAVILVVFTLRHHFLLQFEVFTVPSCL